MDGSRRQDTVADLPWRAPAAAGPVRALLTLPGSKSMTNRALVLAALADGPGTVVNPLRARDTLLMAAALTALGTAVRDHPVPDAGSAQDAGHVPDSAGTAAAWQVTPGVPRHDATVDVGNAGTVLRFLPPVAALTRAAVGFRGDERASQRPVGPLLMALREIGARIDDGGRGAVPFTVLGTGSLAGGLVTLDASASSQLVSGLLLAAPRFGKGIEVRHEGPRAPSAPHIDMTVQMLRAAGAGVEAECRPGPAGTRGGDRPDAWRVQPGVIRSHRVVIEPDLSNAAPFLAAALVTGGTVTIRDWPPVTAQPAGQILDLLTRMGASCQPGPGGMTVTGTGEIRPITADLADAGELVPVVAALAALAHGPSALTGIGHLRRHETDRLAALAAEINALGGDVTDLPGGLEIRPRPLRAGARPFGSYDDHRMVMAAAVLGLAVPGIEVADAATVGKTFPGFTRMWSAMLASAP